MVKVSVLYPSRTGTKFDMTYYLDRHIPMVRRLVGSALKGVSVENGISGDEPGSQPGSLNTCLSTKTKSRLLRMCAEAFLKCFNRVEQKMGIRGHTEVPL